MVLAALLLYLAAIAVPKKASPDSILIVLPPARLSRILLTSNCKLETWSLGQRLLGQCWKNRPNKYRGKRIRHSTGQSLSPAPDKIPISCKRHPFKLPQDPPCE